MRKDYWSELQRLEAKKGTWQYRQAFERASLSYHYFAALDDDQKENVRANYRKMVYPAFEIPKGVSRLVSDLSLWPGQIAVSLLPLYSFVVSFSFQLRKPYLSKDDVAFYVLENPVRKEKVFGLPMVAPTQWKGALRAAMTYQLADWWLDIDDTARSQRANYRHFAARRTTLVKLFGTEKGVLVRDQELNTYLDRVGGEKPARLYRRYLRRFVTSTGFRAGRLRFFPTFFDRIGLEIINPQERRTRSGTLPIYIESVPDGTSGSFILLYFPFDCIGKDRAEIRRQVSTDLKIIGKGLKALFAQYGFGAKTSSGFGVAEDNFPEPGQLALKAVELSPKETEPTFNSLEGMVKKMNHLAGILAAKEEQE